LPLTRKSIGDDADGPGHNRPWPTVPQLSQERPSDSAPMSWPERMPNLAGTHTPTRSDPDLRFFNSLGMNIGGAFNLDVVIRFGDQVRYVVGQESAGLALP
jgi:hypothetical protein